MPVIRKRLIPDEVYPSNIRYNEAEDTVESFVNGEWVENPNADPRRQITLPPRITADTECDAAQSVVDALQTQISATIEAIDNASTLFTIAGIILSLFSFGVFAVFISIALTIGDAMIAAGSTALEAALTPTVYDMLKCILFCEMDDQGRITADGLADVQERVTSEIGGLAATVINSMLSLAGEGGISNLASLGTSTGDCSGCDACPEEWCFRFDFTLSEFGWTINTDGFTFGKYTSGVGFQQGDDFTPADALELESPTIGRVLTAIRMYFDPEFTGSNPVINLYRDGYVENIATEPFSGPLFEYIDFSGATFDTIAFDADPQAGGQQFWGGALVAIELAGIGENPFGADNCL